MKTEDVLTVLNGLEPVDVDNLEFGVITAGTRRVVGTGRAAGQTITLPADIYWPFERGEVLILDKASGREPFGEGRKPAKWSVTCETVATLAEALELRMQVVTLSADAG